MSLCDAYVKWVKANPKQTNRWIKLAIRRFEEDLKKSADEAYPYYFDEEAGKKVVSFIQSLTLWEGRWAGQPFKLEPWQVFFVMNLYGWKRKSDDLRRFTKAFLFVARKNGKTPLASALELVGLLSENGAQCYSIATKRDQAKIAHKNCVQFIQKSESLSELLEIYNASIVFPRKAGKLEPLSSDAKTADGLGPSFVLADEVAAYPNSELINVMQSGMGARLEPLMVLITTGQASLDNPGFLEYERSMKCLAGIVKDETYFPLLYCLDEDDDWMDEKVYIKANPNLGVSITLEALVADRDEALLVPTQEVEFKTKKLNLWLNSSSSWIDDRTWLKCQQKLDITEEELKASYAVGAIDLSKRNDWTAYTVYWWLADRQIFYARHHFYIPEEQIRRKMKSDTEQVYDWIKKGLVKATPGEIIDYTYLYKQIESDMKDYKILQLNYDPWMSIDLVHTFSEVAEMVPFEMGTKKFSNPAKEWEAAIGRCEIVDNSPILRWMVSCANARIDNNNNLVIQKVDYKSSSKRIDGVITSIIAHAALKEALKGTEEQEKRAAVNMADYNY